MEFRNRSLLDLSGAIVGSFTTLTMAFAGAGVWALIAGSLLSQTWKTIGINWLSPFLHWPAFSVKGMRSLFTFGGYLTAAGVFAVFYSQIDIIICAKLLGNEILGIYSVAVHLASLPSQKISGLINAVAFPAFSNMQHNIRKVAENVLLGIRILSFFSFPLCWGMSSIAPEIVDVILGPKWEFSRVPLQVLALIIPWRIVGNFVGIAVQGMGRSDIVLQNTIWGSVVAPPVLFVGAYSGGLIGLSLVWLVVSPVVFLPFLMRSAPVIGLRSKLILAAMAPAAGAGFIMYGVVIAARYMLADWQTELLRMCVLIAAGALAYCAVSIGLNRTGSREVLEMLRSIATTKRV
jgi:O-antigen/teichoic acid export membrane protein